MVAVYLTLAIAAVGGLCWAAYQVMLRQRRLGADLSRLEQLAAEVSMHAEAVLDQADERIARLEALLAEARAVRQVVEEAPVPVPVAPLEAVPSGAMPEPPEPTNPPDTPDVKQQILNLAEQGVAIGEIAGQVGVPRGEVQLILNLRKQRAGA